MLGGGGLHETIKRTKRLTFGVFLNVVTGNVCVLVALFSAILLQKKHTHRRARLFLERTQRAISQNPPSRHTILKERRFNVDARS